MLTLQELKQVVGNREERRKVPSARYLRENDVAVVKQRLIDGAEIIAYRTGYIFYCAGDYGTVFPLFTCRDYVYEAGRKITVVKEDFFDNQPWYVRLILEAEVIVTKQDKDTENPLDGGIFGLYAASDIKNADGTVVVKKGTLIEKVTTGNDGTAKFTADLPLGFSYDVKEVQAPEGYLRNADDVYTFAFSYTNDKEAKLTFKRQMVRVKIITKRIHWWQRSRRMKQAWRN